MTTESPKPLKIGVTGGIAAGKTAVCRLLAQAGARLIDADRIGHELLGGDLLNRVIESLGDSFIREDGAVDRKLLGHLVFSQPTALEKYNSIIHPSLVSEIEKRLNAAGPAETVLLEAALLFEWGIESWFDKVLVVVAPDSLRLERLIESAGLSPREARDRIAGQMDQNEKARRADEVIVNEGSREELECKVIELRPRLGLSASAGNI